VQYRHKPDIFKIAGVLKANLNRVLFFRDKSHLRQVLCVFIDRQINAVAKLSLYHLGSVQLSQVRRQIQYIGIIQVLTFPMRR